MSDHRKLLIRAGYLITMDDSYRDLPVGDVLIDGPTIVDVAENIPVADGCEVIDARGMVVTPGLIDNHRHMWQGLVRGVSANHTFGQYFAHTLEEISGRFTPDDLYLGNLLTAYEAVDAGVTTVLDWSHALNTPAHAVAARQALADSGVRAVLAYGPPSIEWWQSDGQPAAADVERLYRRFRWDDLVGFALAIRGPEFSQMNRVKADIALARELGVNVTMHAGIPGFHHSTPSVRLLAEAGLLGSDLTFVHCNAMTVDDFTTIARSGGHVSFSPEVEMQKGFGTSPLGTSLEGGIRPTVSLDVVTAIGGSLLTQLRFLLQTQRLADHQAALDRTGEPLDALPLATRDVLPYVTGYPAASLALEHRIGSLTPGKQADLVLFDAEDLNMFLSEPTAALVQSAHPGNIHTVLVAGRTVKRHRQLVGVNLDDLRRRARAANRRLLQA